MPFQAPANNADAEYIVMRSMLLDMALALEDIAKKSTILDRFTQQAEDAKDLVRFIDAQRQNRNLSKE